MAFYDDSLIDDASHPHVIAARAAGRAWADREWDSLTPEQAEEQRGQAWIPDDRDALPLVQFGPTSDVEDQFEREQELAAICNAAAEERWDVLAKDEASAERLVVTRVSDDERYGSEAVADATHRGDREMRERIIRAHRGRADEICSPENPCRCCGAGDDWTPDDPAMSP